MKITIAIAKAGRSIDVDTAKLCGGNESDTAAFDNILNKYANTVKYLFNYGATQTLNDAHANPKFKGADNIMAVVEKKLAAIYAGTVKTRGSGAARVADPVTAECIRLAKAWWKKQDGKKAIANAKAKYPALVGKEDLEIAAMLLGAYMKAPETVAKAQATVAAKAMKAEVELDLSDFMPDESDDEESDDEVLMIEDHT